MSCVLVFIGWVFLSRLSRAPHDAASYPPPSAIIAEPAPGFQAKAIVDGEIVDVSTEDYQGKWLVLLFYPKVQCSAVQ